MTEVLLILAGSVGVALLAIFGGKGRSAAVQPDLRRSTTDYIESIASHPANADIADVIRDIAWQETEPWQSFHRPLLDDEGDRSGGVGRPATNVVPISRSKGPVKALEDRNVVGAVKQVCNRMGLKLRRHT